MTLHLQGMGVLGCYLAHRLDADGIPFTWHDTDEPVTAWRASTGAIFPTGHADDQWAMAEWARDFLRGGFEGHHEPAAYVFSTKAPPHGGRYPWTALVGDAKLAAEPSFHLNAQTWVPATRRRFADAKRYAPERGQQVVVTHGFGRRLARYMWGWTVPVRVTTTVDLGPYRPSIYFRRGRFTMAYAYPIPGTDAWYSGSSLISQKVPRVLDIAAKFERWRDDFLDLGWGYVADVEVAGDPVQGWRPVPAAGDDAWVRRLPGGELAVRPLWHSGIRHAPLVYRALREALA